MYKTLLYSSNVSSQQIDPVILFRVPVQPVVCSTWHMYLSAYVIAVPRSSPGCLYRQIQAFADAVHGVLQGDSF